MWLGESWCKRWHTSQSRIRLWVSVQDCLTPPTRRWRCATSGRHFSGHHYPGNTHASAERLWTYFNISHWSQTGRMKTTMRCLPQGPLSTESNNSLTESQLMERLLNITVCSVWRIQQPPPLSPLPPPPPSPSSFSFLLYSTNEQSVLVALLHIWD